MTKDEFQKLMQQMRDRVKREPGNADAWRDLAQAKMMAGDIEGAENDLIECLRIDPKNVNGTILLGNLLTTAKHDDAAALRYFEKAVELDPKSPEALGNYGTLLFKGGDKLKALGYLRKAIEICPTHSTGYYMLAQCYVAMEDWRSAYITAKDAFEKCRITVENEQLTDRISNGLSRIMAMAEAHGGAEPPEHDQKHLEQVLRQRTFDEAHGSEKDTSVNLMMAMYMNGAMDKLESLPKDTVRAIAIEIAMLGTNGIAPDKHSGYKLTNMPGEDFSGYRLLAYYYVSWKIVFPDKLALVGLPFDEAYKIALAMRKRKGDDNSSKTTMGGVIHRFTYLLAA